MIYFFAISSIVTAALSFLLGAVSYLRNRRSNLNKLWAMVSWSTAIWSLGLGMEIVSSSETSALFWNKVLNTGAIFIPIFYYHFSQYLLEADRRRKYYIIIGYVVGCLLLFANLFTPYFVSGVPPKAGFRFWVEPGPLYYPFFGFFVYYILIGFFSLFRNLRHLTGVKKIQAKYVLIAGMIGFGGGVTDFFPQLINTYPYGNFFVVFYIFVITYAIVRHRLLNIRTIITKSVIYFSLVVIVTGIFASASFFIGEMLSGDVGIGKYLAYIGISFSVVIILDPLKRAIANATENIFYKQKINYQNLLAQIGVIIAKEIDLELLLSRLQNALTDSLKVKAVDILVKDGLEYVSIVAKGRGGKRINKDNTLIKYLLDNPQIIITDEFYHDTYDMPRGAANQANLVVIDELERHGIEFCAPVYLEGDLKSIIILGQRQSGDIYTNEDIQFFNTLVPQVAVAIEKSQLYESIGQFNLKLQDKVNKATKRLRDTNLQLQEANAHLTQLDKAKSEFLSIASHQLRTPVAAIKGYMSMMLEGDFGKVDPKQGQVIKDVFESASRLARLINVFLNVSRIESGRFKLDRSIGDINTLVEGVAKELQGQLESKKLKLILKLDKHLPQTFMDCDKVREVVLNLIDNAIKYTPEGSIEVHTFVDNGNVHFQSKDTGIGISPEDAKVLFQKFVRGTGIAQVNTQGSGLGLYIAQRVISEHGGKIWVESEGLGKGSAFHFVLPIIEGPTPESVPATSPAVAVIKNP